jgi:23S rRNA pseudouridine2605 synthase
MRINQYISQCGAASRRKAEALVLEGKVSVNGIVVKELSTQIGETDIVEIEGQKISPVKQRITIAFHKPPGVICTASDPQRRKTIYDCLPSGFSTLKYVGRLDLQSRCLVLISDDGELVHRLTHPRYQI